MHQRVENNAFQIHFCELPVERAKLWPVATPVLERTAGADLEFVVAGLAPNITARVIATALPAPLAVHEADFPGDIHVTQGRIENCAG